MESAPEQVNVKYVVYTNVVRIEERKARDYVKGFGGNAEFLERSLGWFMFLAGSYEAIYIGPTKPDFKFNDRIKITFERAPDAKAKQSPVE